MSVDPWLSVVFLAGEDGRELVDALCRVEGVVARGATDESVAAAVEVLAAWDDDDAALGNNYDGPPWAATDQTADVGHYVLAWNLGLGYVSLSRRPV